MLLSWNGDSQLRNGNGNVPERCFPACFSLGVSAPCRCLSCSVWDLRAVVGRGPPSLARGNWLLIQLLLLLHSFLGSVIN